ncbi:MAG: hypothetical protein ABIK09_12650 [Pseudomonadota bacterium]
MARKRGARRGTTKTKKTREEPGLLADISEIVEIYCSTCHLNLDGTVTALDNGSQVVQVTCRTCDNVQKFRPPMPDEVKRQTLLRKAFAIRDRRQQATVELQQEARKAHSTSDVMARWRKATEDAGPRAPIYRETEVYEVGDQLIHNQHGLGVVQEILHDNAAMVLFRETEVPVEMGKVYED